MERQLVHCSVPTVCRRLETRIFEPYSMHGVLDGGTVVIYASDSGVTMGEVVRLRPLRELRQLWYRPQTVRQLTGTSDCLLWRPFRALAIWHIPRGYFLKPTPQFSIASRARRRKQQTQKAISSNFQSVSGRIREQQ